MVEVAPPMKPPVQFVQMCLLFPWALALVACSSSPTRGKTDVSVASDQAAAGTTKSTGEPTSTSHPNAGVSASPIPARPVAKWPPQQTPEPADPPKVHLKTVAKAARSPDVAPPAWDEAAYRKDPQAYLDEVFPGRVNQTATPAADVPFLVADGGTGFTVAPGSRIVLRVQGEPFMPVTWTSLGLGTFLRTGLTSVSVAADADGHAFATWIATPGTVGNVSILAASPTRAGQVSYLIHITE